MSNFNNSAFVEYAELIERQKKALNEFRQLLLEYAIRKIKIYEKQMTDNGITPLDVPFEKGQ